MHSTERSTRSSRRYVTQPVPDREPPSTNSDSGQYICIECSETFNNKLELNSHRQSHVTKKQFTCSHCGRGFHHQFFLQMHERSHEDGISRPSLSKQSTGRVISTRSSKLLPEADIIHVTATPSKPVYHLNSKVEFKREWNVDQEVTPTECVTRRTQGTYYPACQRTDSPEKKTQIELRISKLTDSTVHLIDPYGNTLEILAEVFNTYTIGEPEEDEESVNPSGDVRTPKIPVVPPSSAVHPEKADEMGAVSSPQAEISEPSETTNDIMEEDLPLCRIESVSSASISPKTVPDLEDVSEDILSTQTNQDVTCSEHVVNEPAHETPKNVMEKEGLPRSGEDAIITCDDETIAEGPITGDVNKLSIITTQTEDPSLKISPHNDPSSVHIEYSEDGQLHKEGQSPETLIHLDKEKDGVVSSHTPVAEKNLPMSVSLGLNKDNDQLGKSCSNDSYEMSFPAPVKHNIPSQSKGGTREEMPLTISNKMQDVTLSEGDRSVLQISVPECPSESEKHHKESISSATNHGSLGHNLVLQTDQCAANVVCDTPMDNEIIDQKDSSDKDKTASKSELEPELSKADVCTLSKGVNEETSPPLSLVEVCPSEPDSLNVSDTVMSLDFPEQSTVRSSGDEETFMEGVIADKVIQSVPSNSLSQIASGTMPILQEAQSPPEQSLEPEGKDSHVECNNTDLPICDSSQKNDSSLEPRLDSDLDTSSLLHHIQPSDVDGNLRDNKDMEVDAYSTAVTPSTENAETESKVSGVTPVEESSLTNIESTVDKAPSPENIQTSMKATNQITVVESSENVPCSLLEPQALIAADGLLPLCKQDSSLKNFADGRNVPFIVPTLASITSACVSAQELVLSQETKPIEQDSAGSMTSKFVSIKPMENAVLKDNALIKKLDGEDSGTTLCLLEPTLDLSPDLEDLSEKCLLSSDAVKDLTETDIEKTLSHEDPDKQYIQMSNADLTENDLADDFVSSGTILLDAPNLEEATKEDEISTVSVEDEGTVHELSDMLSPEIQENEYTEGQDDKNVGFGGPCLKCGRRVRRGRKELVWFPTCYKCRLKAKREERHSGEGASSDFSNFRIKEEAESAQEEAFYRTIKPVHSIQSIKQESAAVRKKMFKCPKCEKTFRIPSLLATHMKCHTSPQCLTCGCPLTLKFKTKRIPKRCQKCLLKIKQQKKAERALHGGDDEDDSLDSDGGSLSSDANVQSLTDDESENEPSLSFTKIVGNPKPGSVKKGTEPFHSILMRKRKMMNPAIHALYCTCDVVLKGGARQPKICKNCQKPVRDRLVSLSKASLIAGRRVHGQTAGGKQPKTKKLPPSELDEQNLLLGESSVSHDNDLSPDDLSKEEMENLAELDTSDQSVPVDGEKPRLCPECGKVFKCNRSLNLHLLSHSATQCESCGCRLQKKKRAGRWSKKCRVCRLLTKEKGLPDSAIEDMLPPSKILKGKRMASLQPKLKQSKMVRSKKLQSAAKLKKELNWMNMILAVKGLTQKPRKKIQSVKSNEEKTGSSSESESSANSGSEETASVVKDLTAPSKGEPGSSGLQKKILDGVSKVNKKFIYSEKNIVKVEEQQLPPYHDDPLSTAVSVKEEEENQCLECNEIFPNFDLLLSHQQGHIEGQPFTCAQCPQRFSTEQYLSMHASAHADGPPFRCPECNKSFTRRNHLGVHRRVHTGSRPYACPDCPCRFRQRGSLIIHRYTHRNLQLMMLKPYQCSVCSKCFKQKERLVIHERLHTGECPFSCKDCDKVFPSKSRLYVHRKIHRVPEASSSVEQNVSCKEETSGPPFQCKNCDKVCSTKASFVLHCKVHKPSALLDQRSSFEETSEGTTNEMPLASEKDLGIKTEQAGHSFSCDDCNKVFSTKASFVLHRKVHRLAHGSDVIDPAFTCKDCGKVCSTKASFVLHRKVHKSPLMYDLKANIGDPPYVCKLCKKVCSTKASFVLHCKVHKIFSNNKKVLKTNMEKKSFVCKKCGFICSTKASFVLHRKIHRSPPSLVEKDGTGQHPFTCKDCNKVCSTKASFVLHCKVHRVIPDLDQSSIPQTDVEEKPYHCKECGKIYSTKGRLLSHLKLHAGQGTSADSEQLLKIDTEEKPFACPICHMRFTRLKILVRHKLIHGEDVLSCVHCGKRFLFQKSLMNHVPVCLKRSKVKNLLEKEKVPKKRKMKDGGSNEEGAPKKRKYESKKAAMNVQKLKNKKLIKVKKMALNKEKSKVKSNNEKKLKKPKGEAEQDQEDKGEKMSDGKQEKSSDAASKEKEGGKDKKPKDVSKVKKVLKKVPSKQKRQKVSSESLKKWRLIAAATVKKRKLQAVISGGKKKATVKKKGPNKAKTGGKNGKE